MMDVFQLIVKFNMLARRHEPIKPEIVINEDNMSVIADQMETELTAIIHQGNELLKEIKIYKYERKD